MLSPHRTLDGCVASKSASPSASGPPRKSRFKRPSWGQPVREMPIPAGTDDDTFSRKKETLEYLRRQQEEQARMAKAAGLKKPVKKGANSKDKTSDSEGSGSDAARGERHVPKAVGGKSTIRNEEEPRKKRRLNSEEETDSSSGDDSMDFRPAVERQQRGSAQREGSPKREQQQLTKAGEQESSKTARKNSVVLNLDSDDADDKSSSKPARLNSPHKPSASPTRSLKSGLQDDYNTHGRSPSPYKTTEYSPNAKPPNQPVTPNPTPAVIAPPEPPQSDPIVRLYIHSRIADTIPLLVQRRLGQRVRECLVAWLDRQDVLTKAQKDEIFLTWRGYRVYSSTSCKGLGLEVNDMGEVCYKGKLLTPEQGDEIEETRAQLVLEAVTQEIVQQEQKAKEEAKRKLEAIAKGEKPGKAKKEESGEAIKIILRAKGMEDFKLKVRKHTPVSQITDVYRTRYKLGPDKDVYLTYDGDRLNNNHKVESLELEQGDFIEVIIK